MTTRFKWIQMFSSVILVIQLTAAAVERSDFIIRDGGEATLSCENLKNDQDKCNGTTWLFSNSNTASITLFEKGKIHREAKNKSDRLSVTAKCSLVIKKLTAEDVGRYNCRRFSKSGQQEGSHSVAELSVVNIAEYKDGDTVTLNCSVSTYKECKYTVKWLYGNKDLSMSQSTCSARVIFTTSDHIYTSKSSEMLKCQVTHDGNVQEFIYRIQSFDQETHENARWWMFIVAPLGLLALIAISAVIAIRWKRAKGKKMETNENPELNLNPAVTPSAPGTTQDSAEPEYAVAYASISYTNTTSKAQGRDKNEGERVTYSTVKASSMDPSNLYDTIK